MRLSIVALGDVHAENLQPLTTRFEHIEQLVLDIPPRDPLSSHRAEFNRAVDAASADWMLIVREREMFDDALAQEVFDAASAAKARGFRIRAVPFYAGRPLKLTREEGEVRLFHRRNYMRFANKGEWDEVMVQGPVVRLAHELRSITFASEAEHREYLAKQARPRSAVKRVLLFLVYLAGTRVFDANTMRYLWNEAGFDSGR
ncbi:MAG TPA: hypothetical protein VHW00_02750 [Thermoanaerobaculia bacterium]|nr:hypothetical protein [Thermoanaerobaculia bacterium]